MSLNYIVNKVVNRYPDDRIRLAVLPAAPSRLRVLLDANVTHIQLDDTGKRVIHLDVRTLAGRATAPSCSSTTFMIAPSSFSAASGAAGRVNLRCK